MRKIIIDKIKSTIVDNKVDNKLWLELVFTMIYVQNCRSIEIL